MTAGGIVAEPLDIHGVGDEGRAARARPRADRDGRPQPRLRRPLSARVLRRPAPAHRHRPGARARARSHRLRRADLRARRLDPGPDHQPARAPPGPARPDLPVHRPRPVGRPPHQRPHRGHVPRPDRRARAVARAQPPAAPPVHGRAPVGRPDPGPESSAAAGGSSSAATCHRPSTRRPAAASTPAAGCASGSATRSDAPPRIRAARALGRP